MAQSKLTIGETENHDEATLYWTIPNFKKRCDTARTIKKIRIADGKFTLGGKNWGFYLSPEVNEGVGIFLEFYGPDCAYAGYKGWFKSSKGEFKAIFKKGVHKHAQGNSSIQGTWISLLDLQNEGFLSDGSLHLKLIVSVYSPKAKMKVFGDLKTGLDSSVGAYVTFIFVEEGGSQNVIDKIKAHRGFLSIRSSVFASLFRSGKIGEVTISEMSPKAFRILLNYIYFEALDEEWRSVADELFHGAGKYNLGDLKKYLCKHVDSVLTMQNVVKIRNAGELYNLQKVLDSTEKFIHNNTKDFLQSHYIIFKNS